MTIRLKAYLAAILALATTGALATAVLTESFRSEDTGVTLFGPIGTGFDNGVDAATVAAPLAMADLRFSHWTILPEPIGLISAGATCTSAIDPLFDGICRDVDGVALNPVQFVIVEDVVAVAHYLQVDQDTDLDGIRDFLEIRYFGSLATFNDPTFIGPDLDGLGLTLEGSLGFSLTLTDTVIGGGKSAGDGALVPIVLNPSFFIFRESSLPPGLVDRTRVLETGATAITQVAQPLVQTLGFMGWSINGIRQANLLGEAINPASIVISGEADAVAGYLDVAVDLDMDGVADFLEERFFGDFNEDGNSLIGDFDPFPLSVELALGWNPLITDLVQSGGVSVGDSALIQVPAIPLLDYLITSEPVIGFTDIGGLVAPGTVVTTPSLGGFINGGIFSYWAIDGVAQRQLGIPLSRVSASINQSTLFTAFIYPPDQDSDGDGIPDWLEEGYYDGVAPNNNPDGDSVTLPDEASLGFSPVLADLFVTGGVSVGDSSLIAIDLRPFPRVREILVSGTPEFFFASGPGNADGSFVLTANSTPALGDYDGDGDPDLLVVGSGGQFVGFENTGSPVFASLQDRSSDFGAISSLVMNLTAPSIGMGDINSNLLDDVAIGGDTAIVRVFESVDGTPGGLTMLQQIDTGLPVGVGEISTVPGLVDLDGNGSRDLLIIASNGSTRAYPNGGGPLPFDEASFSDGVLPARVPNPRSISTGDMNGDGLEDLAVSDDVGNIWEFRREIGGSFRLVSKIYAGSFNGFATNLAAHLTDLDGDGDQDVIAGYAEGGLIYLRNQGKKLLVGPPTQTLIAGDAVDFDVVNPESAITWSVVANNSGASIDVAGLYQSGLTSDVVDIIEARDVNQTLGRAYVNVIDPAQVTLAGKAVIVAAGRGLNDPIWPSTRFLSNKAYLTLRHRGFSRENIHFLSLETDQDVDENGQLDDIDLLTSFDNLRDTFERLVGDTDKLFVYLVDHGSNTGDDLGEFRLDGSTRVPATQIKSWLDDIQLANGAEVILVMDFCYAGSFIDEVVPDPQIMVDRIVLSATELDELAYFVSQGQVSYSDSFFNGVLQGFDLNTSHGLASTSMSAYQRPILDDDASGTFEPLVDGTIASQKTVGASFIVGQDVPVLEVAGTEPAGTLAGTTEALIFVEDISSVYPIDRVWCAIAPPTFTPNLQSGEPVIDVPEVDLVFNPAEQRYEGSYDGFIASGDYKLNCFAQDFWGSVSFPKQTQISQAGVVDKLLIVLGGDPQGLRYPSALNVAKSVYTSGIIRGFDDSTIELLTSETMLDGDGNGTDDKDGEATLAALTNSLNPVAGFAADADRLSLMLISGSNQNVFQINASEQIDGPDLDTLLDALQTTNGTIIHSYLEFAGSGAFVPVLKAPTNDDERIVVASAGADACNALDNLGLTSFTQLLMDLVQQGATIGQSVERAGIALQVLTSDSQQQLLDSQDDLLNPGGFGIANEVVDTLFAKSRYFGGAFVTGEDRPSIGSVFDPETSTNFKNPTIFVDGVLPGTDSDIIERVFAIVTPPTDVCDGVQFEIELFDVGAGRFETTFMDTTEIGRYGFTFYVEDDLGNRSSPAQSTIEVMDDAVFTDGFEGAPQ